MHPRIAVLSALLLPTVTSAQGREFPYSMDFGPYLMTTFDGRGLSDYTYKGVVVKLPQGAVAFDTELLRLSAGWTDGFLFLRGTAYDGAHGPMPRLRGRKVCESRPQPGWARDGDFTDPRSEPYGPLPREWGRYRGLYLHGNDVVVSYQIAGMGVLEHYAIEGEGPGRAVARTLNLKPCSQEQWLVVCDAAAGSKAGSIEWHAPAAASAPTCAFAALQWPVPEPGLVEKDATTTGWEQLSMGGPSKGDYLDSNSGTGATIEYVPQFAHPHGEARPSAGQARSPLALALDKLHDGVAAQNDDDPAHSTFFDRHRVGNDDTDDGRWHVDLQKVVEVSRVSTFTWHRGERAVQQYDLFASDRDAAPALDAKQPDQAGWQKLASVDSRELGPGDKHGVSIWKAQGLGRARHLLFLVRSGGALFSEVDVFADKFRAAIDAGRPAVQNLLAAVKGDAGAAELRVKDGRILMRVPPHAAPLRLKVLHGQGDQVAFEAFGKLVGNSAAAIDLQPLCQPAGQRWAAPVVTKGVRAADDAAYVVDRITVPFDNPYGARMRTCAFDFLSDGRAAVTTWNGDVWLVSGIDDTLQQVTWRRFATGLFDPLGLKVVDDVIYVHGRDGITRLHDTNGDGEADFYECFNNDVHVTRGFHEFAFDLQTDPAGNFYCSKGGPVNPGGRGFMKIAAHHGTVMKIDKNGSKLEVIVTGLRAPNGIGVSPDGKVVTTGDNEGTYIPRCRINWVTAPGFYGGVKDTAHKTPVPDQPDLPLCWMPMEVDNSSGGQCWVTSDRWGPLSGRLLPLSYGTSSLYLVLEEDGPGAVQGGVVRLPCSFDSSAMRARFNGKDGQLYVCGFQGWQTNATKDGGFDRVRYTGKPLLQPVALRTTDKGVYLTFLVPLDPETAQDPGSYGVEIWNYLYSGNYGSPELSILHPERKVEQGLPNRDPLPVGKVSLSPDHKTVFLAVPDMQPVMQMKVTWSVEGADHVPIKGELHNSIHALKPDTGLPAHN